MIDGVGVLAIILGLLCATSRFTIVGFREPDGYRRFRQDLGRGILLGLEFLVAADIIRTVAVVPTLQGVLILGLILADPDVSEHGPAGRARGPVAMAAGEPGRARASPWCGVIFCIDELSRFVPEKKCWNAHTIWHCS